MVIRVKGHRLLENIVFGIQSGAALNLLMHIAAPGGITYKTILLCILLGFLVTWGLTSMDIEKETLKLKAKEKHSNPTE